MLPAAMPAECGADRQAGGQHGAERERQDDHGEAEPEQLRRRRLDLGEALPAVLDLTPGIVGARSSIVLGRGLQIVLGASLGKAIVA